MSQKFYGANKATTGGMLDVSFNSKDASIYFRAAKQVNNNPDKRNYDYETAVSFKFTPDEAAQIVKTIRTDGKWKFYHTFDAKDGTKIVTSGSLNWYEIPAKNEGQDPSTGFGFTGTKGDFTCKVALSSGGAERLAEYLQFALEHIFSSDYSEDKAKALERQAKKAAESGSPAPSAPKTTTKSAAPKSTPKPAPAPVEQEVEAPVQDEDPLF